MNSGFMHTDPYAGYVACGAILIALHHRSRTGKGQVVDLSQQETSIGLMAEHVIEYSMSGRLPARNANADISMAPHGNYPCDGDDSWVAISVRNDGEWVRLCQVMELPGMANDPNYATAAGRVQSASQLDVIVAKWTLTRTAVGVTELLQAQGIPASPVMKARELLGNPHLEERGFFQELDHPDTGRQTYAGVAWRLSKTPGRLLGPSPRLGQHSAEVLQELLGLPSSHVQRLVDAGITGDTPNLND
jgi:crotonobetainyl-CoA:carnitine CoA-transferase CaiB-like acyl-CoA transferase